MDSVLVVRLLLGVVWDVGVVTTETLGWFGGFGGGGGAYGDGGGSGAGGGYSGGGGGDNYSNSRAGGGGSYNANAISGTASGQTGLVRYQNGNTGWNHGSVTIQLVSNSEQIEPQQGLSQGLSEGLSEGSSHHNFLNGLKYEYYSQGYFNDNVNWFNSYTPTSTGYVTNGTNIGTFSNNTRTVNSAEYYSFQWIGYFRASVTGTYTFYTASDDASYLWLGENAVSGYSSSNAVVNNGGAHGVVTVVALFITKR